MVMTGTISNGAIILDQASQLPEGTRVEIVVKPADAPATLGGLLKYAGVIDDMPSDFAAQHDHYIHGTPKR